MLHFRSVIERCVCMRSPIYSILKLEICCPINPLKIRTNERLNYLLNNRLLPF